MQGRSLKAKQSFRVFEIESSHRTVATTPKILNYAIAQVISH